MKIQYNTMEYAKSIVRSSKSVQKKRNVYI